MKMHCKKDRAPTSDGLKLVMVNDQRSLEDQLDDLDHLAARHGLYDAQDWLRASRAARRQGGT